MIKTDKEITPNYSNFYLMNTKSGNFSIYNREHSAINQLNLLSTAKRIISDVVFRCSLVLIWVQVLAVVL